MARRSAKSTATTLYRLLKLPELRSAIRDKYLDSPNFKLINCSIESRSCALISGHMVTNRAKWAERLGGLAGEDLDLGNRTAAAVLLVPDKDGVTWALTYGLGHLLLDQAYVDAGFGQRLAIRVADAEGINSLTRATLDTRAKIDKSSIPSGDNLRGFGIGGFGELVTRVVANASLPGLTLNKPFKIRGADSVSIPLGRTPSSLLSDLDTISNALDRPVVSSLEVLEQLVALKKDSDEVARLNAALSDALRNQQEGSFGVAWPHENVNENGTPAAFAIKKPGTRKVIREGIPTIDDICSAIDKTSEKSVLASLDDVKIQLYSDADGQDAISTDIPLRKWIAFEQFLNQHKFFLHDGRWYRIHNDYAARLRDQVQKIFARECPIKLPKWPVQDNKLIGEKEYNLLAAEEIGGVLLDRQHIRTNQHPRGFEACDILAAGGTLIHIKNIDKSAPASHLFAQGANAAHALSFDEEARQKFQELVANAGGGTHVSLDKPPAAVVFGIARNSPRTLDADSLYSFSQVTLVRTVSELESRGIKTFVVPIDRDS